MYKNGHVLRIMDWLNFWEIFCNLKSHIMWRSIGEELLLFGLGCLIGLNHASKDKTQAMSYCQNIFP